ncbi:G-protein coupled receptor Mth2 isoform X2 [Linepithema humile]|uniref:G-protein coupled receptor Mth2 isoform X2 n=1 Tax=Linepithema humile TaxID=83485 RepID=UPI0006239636|nr:PREDICTED: G-protein coupled receptor Mth2 isoform X2 [Linepithema humile]
MDNCTLDGIMFTAKLVLLSLVLFSAKVSSESYLAKCCPPGQIFSGHATVKCVSVPSSKIELVFQWNATAEFQGLPRCDEPEDITTTPLDDFNSSEFLEVPACLEILHEQITGESIVIVVHCRSNKDRQVKAINTFFPQLAYVKKCCPHGTIFDRRTKACVPQLSKSDSLVIFLQNGSADADLVIIATEAGWPCNGPIIDYEIDEDDIFLRNGTYSVMVPILKNNLVVKEEVFVTENSACLDTTLGSVSNRRLLARVCRNPEFCDGNACIRKCCAEGEFFYANGCSQLAPKEPKEFYQALTSAVNQTKLSAFNMSKEYGVLIGKTCKYGMYPVDPKEEEWWLTSEGHVIADGDEIYDQNNYCMDIFYNKSESDHAFHLFICFDAPAPQEQDSVRFHLNTALEVTSCAFLLMTLLVYACLPSLQNLHGKTLMCHVGSLFLAFTCLVIIPWIMPDVDEEEQNATITCRSLAYTMLFCFLSSFSWLNVMCFDIWWTFGGLRGSTITKAHGHRKRFLLYCLYAFGFSLLVSSLAIVADSTDILPYYLQPDIGYTSCWFTQQPSSYGEMTFFIGPVTIQLISNMAFFILTSVHCNKVKAEIKRVTTDPMDPRSKRFHSDRSRFVMNIKLFTVMGISWIFEVVSFFLKKYVNYWHDAFFYASDVFNCLQGVLIFILFVLKLRVYNALRRRLGLDTKKKSTPTCNATTILQDPYKVRKSLSATKMPARKM